MSTPEARNVFRRLRTRFGGYRQADSSSPEGSEPFGSLRDPGSMADAFDELSTSMGWAPSLARAELTEHWADIVGDDVAGHAAQSDSARALWRFSVTPARGQLSCG